jgi:hypothetical protein
LKLQELHDEWSKDAKIDSTEAGEASANIPVLHSKYLRLLSNERMRYKALLIKKAELELQLEDYFLGKIDGRDIGRPPYQYTITKDRAEKLTLIDPDMVKINLQVADSEERTLFLKEVISNINQRNWQIRNYLEWLKFTQGANL